MGSSNKSLVVNSPHLQTVMIGQQLESDYYVHELPHDESSDHSCRVTINAALLARIEMLEAENVKLKLQCKERASL